MQEKEIKELESSFNVFLNLRRLILKSKYITDFFLHIKVTIISTLLIFGVYLGDSADNHAITNTRSSTNGTFEAACKSCWRANSKAPSWNENRFIDTVWEGAATYDEKGKLVTLYHVTYIINAQQLLEDEDIKWRVYLLQISEKAISFMNRYVVRHF